MTDSVLLRKQIDEKGVKYCALAKKLGLSNYGLQKKIDGENEFKGNEIQLLSDFIGLTVEQRDQIFFAR